MILRKIEYKDVPLMLEWMKDQSITDNFKIDFSQFSEDDVKKFVDTSYQDHEKHYAIVNETDEYLGTISLKHIDLVDLDAEYAICLRKKAQGTNVAYQATKELIEYGFNQLGLNKIYLNVLTENIRANKFYLKFGFKFDKLENDVIIKGVKKELNWYYMTRSEYENH